MRQPSDKAPLTVETREQRKERMAAEAKAKRISDEIDEQIRREMEQTKDKVRVKVLLVGELRSIWLSLPSLKTSMVDFHQVKAKAERLQ